MEISTMHLRHFMPTGSNQIDLVSVRDSIRNSMALSHHFCFGLQQERLCKTDLSGLKLSVNIANPCSKLLKVRDTFRKQTLYV